MGADILRSPYTRRVGSITDRAFARECVRGVDAVLHAATLHKPHVATHAAQQFVDTNVTGTLNLLEEAVAAGVRAFVFNSTTSAFGRALVPAPGEPAAWITESVVPVPKNIYGVTKLAAEHLCELFHLKHGLPCVVLRTSRFFPEPDDDPDAHLLAPGHGSRRHRARRPTAPWEPRSSPKNSSRYLDSATPPRYQVRMSGPRSYRFTAAVCALAVSAGGSPSVSRTGYGPQKCGELELSGGGSQ